MHCLFVSLSVYPLRNNADDINLISIHIGQTLYDMT